MQSDFIRYRNRSGKSGVAEYALGDDYIIVKFKNGAEYAYSYDSAGKTIVEEMKHLAFKGEGLNSYINKYAKYLYV